MKSVPKFLRAAALAIAAMAGPLTPAIGCQWAGPSERGCWRVDY